MISAIAPYFVASIPLALVLLAQAEVQSIAQYGVLGAVLAWFMVRSEKLLERIEHKIVGMNKTMLIWLLESQTTSPRAKTACKEELRKLDPHMADEIGGE